MCTHSVAGVCDRSTLKTFKAIYKKGKKEAELDRQDNLDAWRRSVMSQNLVPHSFSSRLGDIKAEKCGPKLTILASSFYAYRRRRRTNSNPDGKVPSSSTKFSPEERTAYVMHLITDSSRTHGTRPDSGDSTPSADLSVRLLTSSFLIMLPPSTFLDPFIFTQSI